MHAVDYTKLDDTALVALIARRDERALGALYDRYSRLAFSLAVRIVGDRALAEEITADSFISVWRASSSYSSERGRFVYILLAVAMVANLVVASDLGGQMVFLHGVGVHVDADSLQGSAEKGHAGKEH